MHKALMIFNPKSNHGRSWQTVADMRAIVDTLGGADWRGTEFPGHAAEIAAAAQGYDTVIGLGGDGTIHEVVNGLMQIPAEVRPALGVVPVGSGNDFAFALGVSLEQPIEAVRAAMTASPRQVDIGRITDGAGRFEYFTNTCGIGFDAAINIRTRKITWAHGFAMYLAATLQSIAMHFDGALMKVSYDDGGFELPTLMVIVANGSREGGGFMVAPDARIDDGIFEFVYVGQVSRPRMLQLMTKFMNGTHVREPDVHMRRTTRLRLESNRAIPIHLDGELFAPYEANVRVVEVEMLPGALKVRV
ncbi:MAG TPA: diacylglycerol kinase family lipid kinase [Anaerolineales bacterium]|nr:diacylglycerol kinase family lipid kinase [Anaerolineales bacterium]